MTSDQYVVWFIAMAVGILLILGLGTMQMAGLLRRPQRPATTRAARGHEARHQHWYDRFHLHHHAA